MEAIFSVLILGGDDDGDDDGNAETHHEANIELDKQQKVPIKITATKKLTRSGSVWGNASPLPAVGIARLRGHWAFI